MLCAVCVCVVHGTEESSDLSSPKNFLKSQIFVCTCALHKEDEKAFFVFFIFIRRVVNVLAAVVAVEQWVDAANILVRFIFFPLLRLPFVPIWQWFRRFNRYFRTNVHALRMRNSYTKSKVCHTLTRFIPYFLSLSLLRVSFPFSLTPTVFTHWIVRSQQAEFTPRSDPNGI